MNHLDRFLDDSRKLVGMEAADVPFGFPIVDRPSIRRFATALGDRNDLYYDPVYCIRTRYQTLTAPPPYLVGVRTPSATGAFNTANYGLAAMQSGLELEWLDVIRLGQRLHSELTLVDVREGQRTVQTTRKRTGELRCTAAYCGSYEGLIGKAKGVMTFISYTSGHEFLLDREIYQYSEKELAHIVSDMDAMLKTPIRGMIPRYWADDVSVGDELPQLVKHQTLNTMEQWVIAEGRERVFAELVFRNLTQMKGRIVQNPTTNWPFWDVDASHEDINSAQAGGYHAPYSRGLQVACFPAQLLTNWMGDTGFLRRLTINLDVPNSFLYGDTLWIKGTVVDKYKEKIDNTMYHAVDVDIQEVNQLDDMLGTGTATVYLPDRGHDVKLPIPS
jgi:acyl dehydratase